MNRAVNAASTNVRLAYASAATLFFVGVFMLVRSDSTLQTVLGLALLLAGVGVAVAARTADTRRGR